MKICPCCRQTIKEVKSLVIPSYIDQECWLGFLEMRKKIKSPPTEYAKKKILNKLERFKNSGFDVNAVLDASIVAGWKDVYEPKDVPKVAPAYNNSDGFYKPAPEPEHTEESIRIREEAFNAYRSKRR